MQFCRQAYEHWSRVLMIAMVMHMCPAKGVKCPIAETYSGVQKFRPKEIFVCGEQISMNADATSNISLELLYYQITGDRLIPTGCPKGQQS